MENPSKASGGSAAGLVRPASAVHVLPESSSPSMGFSVATSASVEAGPMISMLPISNLRSSTTTAGCCLLADRSVTCQSCRKPAGCTRSIAFLLLA